MRERSLLDIMSQIDDGFIAEAANPEILLAAQRKKRCMMRIKRISGIAACALVAVSVVSAIPILRLTSNYQRDESVSMDANNSNALQESIDFVISPSDAADAESETKDAMNSMQVEAEAAKKAAEEEKAKAEAAEKAAEEAKAKAESARQEVENAQQEATKLTSTTLTHTTAANAETESERVGQIKFFCSQHILLSMAVDTDFHLTSLVLPSEVQGEQVITLAANFWRYCLSYPDLKQITIPETVIEFGDISYLSKEIEIICTKNSAADKFFTAHGYTVINP